MTRGDLAELFRNGESSGVEFKRDDVRPERLAREMAALLNFEGGHVLLGVDDDGTVRGLAREPRAVEEWVNEVARARAAGDDPVLGDHRLGRSAGRRQRHSPTPRTEPARLRDAG